MRRYHQRFRRVFAVGRGIQYYRQARVSDGTVADTPSDTQQMSPGDTLGCYPRCQSCNARECYSKCHSGNTFVCYWGVIRVNWKRRSRSALGIALWVLLMIHFTGVIQWWTRWQVSNFAKILFSILVHIQTWQTQTQTQALIWRKYKNRSGKWSEAWELLATFFPSRPTPLPSSSTWKRTFSSKITLPERDEWECRRVGKREKVVTLPLAGLAHASSTWSLALSHSHWGVWSHLSEPFPPPLCVSDVPTWQAGARMHSCLTLIKGLISSLSTNANWMHSENTPEMLCCQHFKVQYAVSLEKHHQGVTHKY